MHDPYPGSPKVFITGLPNQITVINSDNNPDFGDHTKPMVTFKRLGFPELPWPGATLTKIGPSDVPTAVLITLTPPYFLGFFTGFFARLKYLLTGKVFAPTGLLTGNLQKPHSGSATEASDDLITFEIRDVTVLPFL